MLMEDPDIEFRTGWDQTDIPCPVIPGGSFEEERCREQALTFGTFESEMKRRALEFGKEQMRSLKLIREDGLYTNLALLLSDQCPFTTTISLFQGPDRELFRDRKEFSGSILKQAADAYELLDFCNRTRASFSKMGRTDVRDYPEEAVREALLNSVVHRDYSYRESTRIQLSGDRLETVSPGELDPCLELKSIFLGASIMRNPNLAEVFYRLRLANGCGSGIRRILHAYGDFSQKPQFETARGVFRVILPNRNCEGPCALPDQR